MAKSKVMTPAETTYEITRRKAQAAVTILSKYVEERKLAVETNLLSTTVDAIKLMDDLHFLKEDIAERAKSPAEKLYDILRFTTVPNLMDGEDITSIGVDEVGKCHLQDDVSVKVENKEALFAWLTSNELEDMITEQVNAQTLAAFIRRRIKEAATESAKTKKQVTPVLPDEKIITIKPLVRAVITRS